MGASEFEGHTPGVDYEDYQELYQEQVSLLEEQAELVAALVVQRDALKTALQELGDVTYTTEGLHQSQVDPEVAEAEQETAWEKARAALAIPDPDAGETVGTA